MAHHHETIPVAVSISLAAELAGVSRATFRKRFVQSGLCALTGFMEDVSGVGAGRVWTWQLEQALGRELTVEEVQQADKRLDQKERRCSKNYRAKQQRVKC